MSTSVDSRRVWHWWNSGWNIVPVAAFLMMATLPGRTHGLGLITTRLVADFSISDLQFAYLNFWATLIGAAFCWPCGYLIDRLGLRIVATCTLAFAALSVLLMSRCEQTWQLAISLVLLRGFAQGMLSVISITIVGKWFGKQVGPAMGVYAVLMSLMMAVATAWLGAQVSALGWRDSWAAQGWVLLMAVPVVAILTRNPPTDLSVLNDPEQPTGHSAALGVALRTGCFWAFTLSISFFGMVSSGLTLFSESALQERGFDESVYHQTLVYGFLIGLVANLIAGVLAKRIPLAKLLSFAMLLLAASLAWFPLSQTVLHIYLYATMMAIAGGILTVLFFAVWRHAFGPQHLGQIQAAAQTISVLASATGPLVVATSAASSGSYAQVYFVSAIIAAAMSIAVWFTEVPNRTATGLSLES